MPFPFAAVGTISGLFSAGSSLASAFGGGSKSEGHASKRNRRENTRRWEIEHKQKLKYAAWLQSQAESQTAWERKQTELGWSLVEWEKEQSEKSFTAQKSLAEKSLDAALISRPAPKRAGMASSGILVLAGAGLLLFTGKGKR